MISLLSPLYTNEIAMSLKTKDLVYFLPSAAMISLLVRRQRLDFQFKFNIKGHSLNSVRISLSAFEHHDI
jgi:hypothetical protein